MTARRSQSAHVPGVGMVRSLYERDVLKDLIKRCVKFEYEKYRLSYTQERVYTPDIVFKKLGGGLMFIELKGRFTAEDRRKMLDVKRCHPERDIRMVFMRAGDKIARSSKTTYGMWATSAGFEWAEGREIPAKWLHEVTSE